MIVAQACPTLCKTHQAPLSMEFSTQGYWSGLPFPTPGDPPPGLNLSLLLCRQILYHLSHHGSLYKKSISIPKISISEDYLLNITKNACSRLKVNIIHNRTALKLPLELEPRCLLSLLFVIVFKFFWYTNIGSKSKRRTHWKARFKIYYSFFIHSHHTYLALACITNYTASILDYIIYVV